MIAIHKQGEFTSFQQWVNKARSWIGGTRWLCVDAKGRQCKIGAHMMLAEKEGAFPVSFGPPVVQASRPVGAANPVSVLGCQDLEYHAAYHNRVGDPQTGIAKLGTQAS